MEDHIATIGATSVTDCLPCHEGYYSSVAGSTACKIIPAGGYSLNKRTLEFCPIDTYSTMEGAMSSSTCLPCEEGFFTRSVGSTACEKRIDQPSLSIGSGTSNNEGAVSPATVYVSSSPRLTDMLLVAVLSAVIALLFIKAVSSLCATFNDWLWSSGSRVSYEQASHQEEDVNDGMEAQSLQQIELVMSPVQQRHTSNTFNSGEN